ncbi:MAG: type IX secretion system membrane protein PorP/SprF [Flavobacteriaceae bacterium]|nr:type IX secretion system membrane protein PorP/SprF [Flavobacteriaceae bacterium]
MKQKMNYVLVLFLLFVGIKTYGQQDPQYTQYMYNMNVLNPAYAGSEGTLNLRFLGRYQWVGIEGSPRTLTAAINAPVGKRVGLGLSVIADKIGPATEQNVFADFSYTLPVSETGRLAFGLKAGFNLLNVNLTNLRLNQAGDDMFKENIDNQFSPNFGAGLFYYTDSYYLGLSVPNILATRYISKDSSGLSQELHGFLTAGIIFDINDDLKLKPSTMVKAAIGAPLSLDLSLNALFKNFLELGLSWRAGDSRKSFSESISGLINVQVSRSVRVGYAYDHTLSELSNYNSGSHEIMLLINIATTRDVMVSPRFF